jgi:arginyl-tRNA synthetase
MPVEGLAHLHLLKAPHEADLLRELARYAELIPAAAQAREPHRIAVYLRELAHALHSYYTSHMFLVEDPLLRHARLCLIAATRQVLANGLKIIGVKAAESM